VTDVAVLAPDVAESLPDDAEVPADLQAATEAVAAELRAEAARCEGDIDGMRAIAGAGHGAAPLLRRVADQLAQPRAALGVDRLVHELVGRVLADSLGMVDGTSAGAPTAPAFALLALARHDVLWPGASARLGSSYSYDSILAGVRLAALAGRES